tara:strand:- start:55 stop:288 length:234 start_codon:yes stop_codon:yes gene_type:complete
MNKLEFTNKVIDNLNDSIQEDGKVELAKFIELTNKLYEAINYTHSCTELRAECECNKGKNGEGMDLVRDFNKAFRSL